jgi:hypothetical protein
MASVGPLDDPGQSKNARMSAARCFRVRPSLRSSISGAGTPLARESMTDRMTNLPSPRSGSR